MTTEPAVVAVGTVEQTSMAPENVRWRLGRDNLPDRRCHENGYGALRRRGSARRGISRDIPPTPGYAKQWRLGASQHVSTQRRSIRTRGDGGWGIMDLTV